MEGVSKNQIIAIVVFLFILGGGLYYWYAWTDVVPEEVTTPSEAATGGASVLPRDAGTSVPEVNPIQKANPFGGTYKNPFE